MMVTVYGNVRIDGTEVTAVRASIRAGAPLLSISVEEDDQIANTHAGDRWTPKDLTQSKT